MIINRDNYEIYFLDFFEGKLDAKLVDELMLFLDLNYDLKEEFDAFDNTSIPLLNNVTFPDKEILRKISILSFGSVTKENYQEKLIAALEGDLDKSELAELTQFVILNPSVQKEQELFAKTLITPDTAIVFENKEGLKKNIIIAFACIDKENYQEKIIDFYEGESTLKAQSDLKEFIRLNPFLQKEFELFGKTKLEPDTEIVFDGKEQLKRADVPVYTLKTVESQSKIFNFRKVLYPLSVAASVALILSIYFAMDLNTLTHGDQTARNTAWDFNRKVDNTIDQNTEDQHNNTNGSDFNVSSQNNSGQTASSNVSNTENMERIHSYGTTAIAAPVKQYPNAMETQDTYSELYEIIRERRNAKTTKEEPQNNTYSIDQFALYNVKKSLKPKSERGKVRPDDKISLWDVADAGIRGFNNITGAEAKLKHSGNSSFSLALGDRFSVSRTKGEKK